MCEGQGHRSKVKVTMSKNLFSRINIVCLTYNLVVKIMEVKVKGHGVKVKFRLGQGQIRSATNTSLLCFVHVPCFYCIMHLACLRVKDSLMNRLQS